MITCTTTAMRKASLAAAGDPGVAVSQDAISRLAAKPPTNAIGAHQRPSTLKEPLSG